MPCYPTFEELIEGADANNLLEVRRSFLSVFGSIVMFVALLFIILVINLSHPLIVLPDWVPFISYVSPRWLAIIPAGIALEVLRKYHNDIYVFSSHSVRHHQGRIALKSSLPSIKYVDILAVRVKQDVWGRILNYGNVELDTAGSDDVELTMTGVRAPSELAEIVDNFRRHSQAKGAVESGAALQPDDKERDD